MKEKLIHYCWFGGNPLPEKTQKYIESWKRFCPDYKIIRWDESNFDINICNYVKQAYECKKWAFVSDFARFWILYNYGGVYMDTDVELLKSLDNLPDNFVGFEISENNDYFLASGLIRGAKKGDKICKIILDSYYHDDFIIEGHQNLKTVCIRETEIFRKFGLRQENRLQNICNTSIYPTEYFCPMNFITGKINITNNTISIHWYDSSWFDKDTKNIFEIKRKIKSKFPAFLANPVCFIYGKGYRFIQYSRDGSLFKRIKKKL